MSNLSSLLWNGHRLVSDIPIRQKNVSIETRRLLRDSPCGFTGLDWFRHWGSMSTVSYIRGKINTPVSKAFQLDYDIFWQEPFQPQWHSHLFKILLEIK